MIRTAVVVALVSLAPTRSVAQGAPEAARPPEKSGASPEKGGAPGVTKLPQPARDLARALTSEDDWDEILDAYAATLSGQMSAALAAKGKEPPGDLREKVRGELGEAVRYEQAIEMQASALAIRFSQDELSELDRFYRSAAGKKLLDLLPEVSQQVNEDLRERLSQRIPAILERHAPALAEKGAAPPAAGEGSKTPAKKPDPKAQGRRAPGGSAPPRP